MNISKVGKGRDLREEVAYGYFVSRGSPFLDFYKARGNKKLIGSRRIISWS